MTSGGGGGSDESGASSWWGSLMKTAKEKVSQTFFICVIFEIKT